MEGEGGKEREGESEKEKDREKDNNRRKQNEEKRKGRENTRINKLFLITCLSVELTDDFHIWADPSPEAT